MTGRRRRALGDSFRLLVTDERWFFADLLAGTLAAVVWVVATGGIALYAADAAGFALGVGPGQTPSRAAAGLFAVLWLLVPAVAVVVRLRQRTSNLRGNVQQYYRFDHPAALLAPPALFVVAAGAVAVVLGTVPGSAVFAFVPLGLFVLVRTLAYSYRVYAFSHPIPVQVGGFVSTVAMTAGTLVTVAGVTGRQATVEAALSTVGLPASLLGGTTVGPITLPWAVAVVAVPVGFALAYVAAQSLVALAVRLVEPEVDRSKMRTGQRYPPFLENATPVAATANSADASEPPSSNDTGGNRSPSVNTGEASPDASDSEDDTVADSAARDDDLDDVSNTRVFTPPADGDASLDAAGAEPSGSDAAEAGGGSADETRAVSGTGGDGHVDDRSDADDQSGDDGGTRERCEACGESFTVDTAVRFCPNCGTPL